VGHSDYTGSQWCRKENPGFMFVTMNVIQDPRTALTTMVYDGSAGTLSQAQGGHHRSDGWMGRRMVGTTRLSFQIHGPYFENETERQRVFCAQHLDQCGSRRTNAAADDRICRRRSLLHRLRLSTRGGIHQPGRKSPGAAVRGFAKLYPEGAL